MWLELKAGKLRKETRHSVGYDIFYAGEERALIRPGERALLSTGIVAKFEPGHAGLFWDKSGYANRLGLTVLGGLIDPDYPDEWKVILLNTSKEPVVLSPGDKLTQVFFVKLPEIVETVAPGASITIEEVERTGGFGSTGTR